MVNNLNGIILVYIIVDVIMFIISITLFLKGYYKIKKCNILTGEIINVKKRQDRMDVEVDIISPIIKYSINGKEYVFEGNYCSPKSKIGDKIEILYDKNNPEKVSVKKGLFIAPIIIGSIALFFLLTLAVYFLVNNF